MLSRPLGLGVGFGMRSVHVLKAKSYAQVSLTSPIPVTKPPNRITRSAETS